MRNTDKGPIVWSNNINEKYLKCCLSVIPGRFMDSLMVDIERKQNEAGNFEGTESHSPKSQAALGFPKMLAGPIFAILILFFVQTIICSISAAPSGPGKFGLIFPNSGW